MDGRTFGRREGFLKAGCARKCEEERVGDREQESVRLARRLARRLSPRSCARLGSATQELFVFQLERVVRFQMARGVRVSAIRESGCQLKLAQLLGDKRVPVTAVTEMVKVAQELCEHYLHGGFDAVVTSL